MNSRDMAQGYLRMAKVRLQAAGTAQDQKHYAFTVRLCQETVELSLKAALRFVGVEPPHWHDVGPVFKENITKFPEKVCRDLDRIVSISRSLRLEREASMYGDEVGGIPPDEMYTPLDSKRSIGDAEFIYQLCKDLIPE